MFLMNFLLYSLSVRATVNRMTNRRKSLSTGDIARHCQVTPATVVNWIKAGKLDVYSTPGGQYRMGADKFVQFLEDNDLPVPEELQPSNERRVMLIDSDPAVLEHATLSIAQFLPTVILEESNDGYDGLINVGALKPHALVLDLGLPNMDIPEAVRRLRHNGHTRNMFLVAVEGMDGDTEVVRKVRRIGVDVVLKRPVNHDELARTLGRLLKLPAI